MIRRETRLVFLGKVAVAFAGAVLLVVLSGSTASAAPPDKVTNQQDVCIKDAKTGEYQCNGESLVAKQCDQTKKVSDEWTNSWYALTPAVVGCAAIASLDRTLSVMGIALDKTTVNLATDGSEWEQIVTSQASDIEDAITRFRGARI